MFQFKIVKLLSPQIVRKLIRFLKKMLILK
jgi:hypothetical protein